MSKSTHFSLTAPVFQGRQVPEEGTIVGYGALIHSLKFKMPMADRVAMVSYKNKGYETDEWLVMPQRYLPDDHSDLDPRDWTTRMKY